MSTKSPTELPQPIVLVGGGVMGTALCRGLIESGVATPGNIVVADIDPSKRKTLDATFSVRTVSSAKEAAQAARLVFLAVKPQSFQDVAADLSGKIPAEALVISIMAGMHTKTICSSLDHDLVIRAMPNAAASVRQSMTVWYACESVPSEQRSVAAAALAAIGDQLEVDAEATLDVATAVSGSGPAFICLAAEALIEGAVAVGCPRGLAERLVSRTLVGAAALLRQPGAHPGSVRESITSPGGTTAAGLMALESRAVRAAYAEAVRAAYARSQALQSLHGRQPEA